MLYSIYIYNMSYFLQKNPVSELRDSHIVDFKFRQIRRVVCVVLVLSFITMTKVITLTTHNIFQCFLPAIWESPITHEGNRQ